MESGIIFRSDELSRLSRKEGGIKMDDTVKLFILKQFILLVVNLSIQFLIGTLVLKKNLLVNYSRKMMHFMGFFTPIILELMIKTKQVYTAEAFVLGLIIYLITMLIYIKPIREKSWIISRMFMSFDRPEDRPHTLLWLLTQMAAGYLVMAPSFLIFQSKGYMNISVIPILINAIGDGLAEPIGVKFGKHKYQVKALFSKKKYVRTLEGSACVFITSVLILLMFKSSFTINQFYAILAILPLVSTLAEAYSPHTWDTPLIFLVGFVSLNYVKMI